METTKLVAAVVMVAATVMSMTTTAEELATQPCVSKLYACKSADLERPSDACCEALKEEAKSDRDCLCTVLNDPNLLRTFNVTADQVHSLATACGVSDGLSSCSAPSSSPNPSSPISSSSDKGGGHKANWIGMFSFVSSSLVWSMIMA